ncbi:uncharacterized protein LOC134814909 [Bolinopsis microptera]|uniref:uncharacterized protein LOC134814909 n=1 Tax=Bolinopsis microptera TaxID=2820187 RepID=UPI0030796DE6
MYLVFMDQTDDESDSNIQDAIALETIETEPGKKRKPRRRKSNLSRKKNSKRNAQILVSGNKRDIPDALGFVNNLTKTNKLQHACTIGDLDETRRLMENLSYSQLLKRDTSGDTALHNAIINGLGIIKQLGNNNVPGLVSDSDGYKHKEQQDYSIEGNSISRRSTVRKAEATTERENFSIW